MALGYRGLEQSLIGRLLYLHGFLSGPSSRKAQDLQVRMRERGLGDAFLCPQLPVAPQEAIALAESLLQPGTVLVGSSLGGFYATWLCEHHPERVSHAVLVNPAVVAYISLAQYIGKQKNLYTGEAFDFTQTHIDAMHALDVPELKRQEAYWLLAEEGDEVLDYRQAVSKYQGAKQTVLSGGNHTFSRWHDYLDAIIDLVERN